MLLGAAGSPILVIILNFLFSGPVCEKALKPEVLSG